MFFCFVFLFVVECVFLLVLAVVLVLVCFRFRCVFICVCLGENKLFVWNALRVAPAETWLTVYRRRRVCIFAKESK